MYKWTMRAEKWKEVCKVAYEAVGERLPSFIKIIDGKSVISEKSEGIEKIGDYKVHSTWCDIEEI